MKNLKRSAIFLTAFAIIASALALTALPSLAAPAKLEECEELVVAKFEMVDHPGGWGTYKVTLNWAAYPGAVRYEVRITPADGWKPHTFKTNDNEIVLPAWPFRDGPVKIVVVAFGKNNEELCYGVSDMNPEAEGLKPWNPPAADPGPYPVGTGVVHNPAAPASLCPLGPAQLTSSAAQADYEDACKDCGGNADCDYTDDVWDCVCNPES